MVYDSGKYRRVEGKDKNNPEAVDADIDVKYNSVLCSIGENTAVGRRIIVVGAIEYIHHAELGSTEYKYTDFTNRGSRVDVYAPGKNILTMAVECKNTMKYTLESGTSIAAPFISGLVASMYQANPKLKADYIKGYLKRGSNAFMNPNEGEEYLLPDAEKCYQIAMDGVSSQGNNSSLPTGFVCGYIENTEGNKLANSQITAIRTTVGESRLEDNMFTFYSDLEGDFVQPLPHGTYDLMISSEGYIPMVIKGIEIRPDESTYLKAIILNTNESVGNTTTIRGQIVNALNGELLPGVEIRFRKNWNNQDGVYLSNEMGEPFIVETDGNGEFQTELNIGTYTVELSKEGFITDYYNLSVSDGNSFYMVMTPILSEDEYRIILTWSDTPGDLDSHLTYYINGEQLFHVSFYEKKAEIDGEVVASLDLDDTSSYGPETITITIKDDLIDKSGVFKYSVHNFTDTSQNESIRLSLSDACVRVYKGNNKCNTYYIPIKREGTVWHVFDMENGEIKAKNDFYYSSAGDIE